jgi:hypothetical protein
MGASTSGQTSTPSIGRALPCAIALSAGSTPTSFARVGYCNVQHSIA